LNIRCKALVKEDVTDVYFGGEKAQVAEQAIWVRISFLLASKKKYQIVFLLKFLNILQQFNFLKEFEYYICLCWKNFFRLYDTI
jgi:hypothetical protein